MLKHIQSDETISEGAKMGNSRLEELIKINPRISKNIRKPYNPSIAY